jgi:two-component system sensor histidine kinase YesM
MPKNKLKALRPIYAARHLFKKISGSKSNILFKVAVGFMVMGIVPVSLLSILYFNQMRQEMYSQVSQYSTEIITGVAENLSREMAALENVSIDIAYMDDVQDICNNYNEMSTANLNIMRQSIRMEIAFKLSYARDVTDVYLYVPMGDRLVLYGDERNKFNLKKELEDAFLQEAYNKNGHTMMFAFSGEHQIDGIRKQYDERRGIDQCLLIGRAIRSLSSNDILGVIVVRIDENLMARRLNAMDIGSDAQMIIYDAGYNVISSTNEDAYHVGNVLSDDIIDVSEAARARTSDIDYIVGDNIVIDAPVDDMDWRIMTLVSRSSIDERLSLVFVNLAFLLVPICLAIIFGIRLFYNILARPLTRLVNAMNCAENGNLEASVQNNSSDEVGKASRSFNKMIERIRQLLEDVKQQEKAKRHAELAALQAQINPHFLSNTLNTARCMAQMQKADNIENLLTSLVELLHISMDISNDFITLREELSYIRSYVDIMQYRNYTPFDIIYQVQPELQDSLVPKLILQPLVENALTHGLNRKKSNGQIIIKASGDDQDIRITIIDNGQGIKPDKVEGLLNVEDQSNKMRFSGIGLSNVNQRIKILFGDKYGLQIESIYLMYTTVTLTIPNIKGENRLDKSHDCG